MTAPGFVRRALVVAAGLLVVLAMSACGGSGDSLSMEEYLQEMERLDNEAEARQATLRDQFEAATTGESGSGALTDGFKEALEVYYVGLVDAGKDFINAVDDLQPPDEAQEVHDEYVAAYDELLAQLNIVVDQIPSLTTSGDMEALLSTPELDAAFARGNAACAGLQQLATDNTVAVDFGCQV